MKFRGFHLHHNNAAAAESMIRQIDEFPSFFTPPELTPSRERPLIIDCGSNIGVTVLEWKFRWPMSEIICFEPDPVAFKMLDKNIEANDIPGIRCINKAVLDHNEDAEFFGDLSPGGDARGNSVDPAWAKRDGSTSTIVQSTRLTPYIADRDVAFLKLDIEGAEQRVITDIQPHLDRIAAIYIEVHETDDSVMRNSAAEIESIVTEAGFKVEHEQRDGERSLPRHLDQWQARVGATQTQLLCWR
ncbi:31-O-demethyl-FK506 methyltransferase FkbM [Rubripirellula obstinata]|uniref:31-O-demethyl-FK506 methyltransferase FkbM n=2 Tax=Rubripirellula obstinata TaxID=406547 RepID=A0A5B1CPR4_9BACT|nr:FkbM family methyltransferase [Rubripirellula obstinata]KAA1262362.1 31-O-demethyl-FK506 methyltransferase FkbM [Rubripirellula obstinata]